MSLTNDKMVIPCMHCLFLRDWTWADAAARTMVKHRQEDSLFLDATFRDCHACRPKRHIPPFPYSDLDRYYRDRGLL